MLSYLYEQFENLSSDILIDSQIMYFQCKSIKQFEQNLKKKIGQIMPTHQAHWKASVPTQRANRF